MSFVSCSLAALSSRISNLFHLTNSNQIAQEREIQRRQAELTNEVKVNVEDQGQGQDKTIVMINVKTSVPGKHQGIGARRIQRVIRIWRFMKSTPERRQRERTRQRGDEVHVNDSEYQGKGKWWGRGDC
ncbi:hypothetical protein C8J56DRAFT_897181 [Mycena floridula]|nr:hypothetical protein C8J56DRAFT_897181 [Mycena floridula]